MNHFVYIPFTGVGIDLRDPEWLYERIQIFKKYTLKSLANQSNKDFTLWLSFRPEDEFNPLISALRWSIEDAGFAPIFTFDGLMYHDDKFGGTIGHRIWNAGRLFRAAWRNNTWHHLPFALYQMLFRDKNKTLVQRLARSLEHLRYKVNQASVLLTRIDSDDMFHRDAIKHLQERVLLNKEQEGNIEPEAYLFPIGYIFNTDTKQMAEYNPKSNPPFHTLVMNCFTFLDAKKHFAFYRGYRSHEDIPKLFEAATFIPTHRMFCVTTHNPRNHISTVWNHPYRGKVVNSGILQEFGVSVERPAS